MFIKYINTLLWCAVASASKKNNNENILSKEEMGVGIIALKGYFKSYPLQKYVPPYEEKNKDSPYFTQKTPKEQEIIKAVAPYLEKDGTPYPKSDEIFPGQFMNDVYLSFNTGNGSQILSIAYSFVMKSIFYYPFTIESKKSSPKTILPGLWVNFIMDLLIREATQGNTSSKYNKNVIKGLHRYYENPKKHKDWDMEPKVKGEFKEEHTGLKTLPPPVLSLIAIETLPLEFRGPKILVNIYHDVEKCANLKEGEFEAKDFLKCIAEKTWSKWVSEKTYEMVGRFARNHSIIDKEINPFQISYINVLPIVEAMFIATSYGLELDQHEVPISYSQAICSRITEIVRRMIPESISYASLNAQACDCKDQTESKKIFELAYNRALMLATLSRIYVSEHMDAESYKDFDPPCDCKFSGLIVLLPHREAKMYPQQVNGWLGYFING